MAHEHLVQIQGSCEEGRRAQLVQGLHRKGLAHDVVGVLAAVVARLGLAAAPGGRFVVELQLVPQTASRRPPRTQRAPPLRRVAVLGEKKTTTKTETKEKSKLGSDHTARSAIRNSANSARFGIVFGAQNTGSNRVPAEKV